jgi:hypothetical protein
MNHQHLGNVQTHILVQKLSRILHFMLEIGLSFYFKTYHNFLGSWSNKLCAKLTSNRWAWHEVGYFRVCENLLVKEHSYCQHLFVVVLLMYKEPVPFFNSPPQFLWFSISSLFRYFPLKFSSINLFWNLTLK